MEEAKISIAGQSIRITKRTDRSVLMFILQHLLKPFGPLIVKPGKAQPAGSPKLHVPSAVKKHCDVRERTVEGINMYDFGLKQTLTGGHNGHGNVLVYDQHTKSRRLYYFAGGAFQMPPSSEHWALCAELTARLPDTTVSLVSYPLAPNSPAPSTFPVLQRLYRQLLRDAEHAREKVIFAGDSAGGNVILCMTIAALIEDETGPRPVALMAISPSVDPRGGNPDMKVAEKHDPILRIAFSAENARKWRGEWSADDPRVNPMTADVTVLARSAVKVHGVTGRYDILGPDGMLFRDRCNIAGVEGEWLDWDKQMHCFPLAWKYGLKESKQAKDWVIDVLRKA